MGSADEKLSAGKPEQSRLEINPIAHAVVPEGDSRCEQGRAGAVGQLEAAVSRFCELPHCALAADLDVFVIAGQRSEYL